MADISIAILGLGRLGTSVGLALKRYNESSGAKHHFTVTGFTSTPDQGKQAQQMKALDHFKHQAHEAVAGQDIVVMAMPYAEVEATYQYIGQDFRPGAVIVDFSPLKRPSLNWAKEHLSSEVHLIGATPLINPSRIYDGADEIARASNDLFDGGLMLLMPSVTSIPAAIELGSDFATILGSKAQFIDPDEHDSLMASMESLPSVLGVAYFYMMMNNRGWSDAQRFSNTAFSMLTHRLFDTHPDDMRDLWMGTRTDLVRHMDTLIGVLKQMRNSLAESDRDTLESTLGAASEQYEEWYNRRVKNNWDKEALKAPDSNAGGVMNTLFGGFISNRLRDDDDK